VSPSLLHLASAEQLLPALDRFLEVNQRTRKRRNLDPIERRLERQLAKAFRIQGAALLEQLPRIKARLALQEAALRTEDWEPLFSQAALTTIATFVDPLTVAVTRSLELGARHAIADLRAGLTFSLADPEAVAYLERVGAELVAGINDTTRAELRTLLTRARLEGWGYDKIAAEIRHTFTGFGTPSPLKHIRARAHLVAVTETGNAYEAARRAMADRLAAAGLEMQKSWLTVGDARVDPDCAGNEDEGWIPIDQAFSSGHDQPTAHPGCRCTCEWRRAAVA
jgi:Phage Mu protein F like protein